MSVETHYKFSCDYFYISIFCGYLSTTNLLVRKFASACTHARASYRVPRLREGSLMSVDTPYEFSCYYSYISIFCGYLSTVNLLVWKFAQSCVRASSSHRVPWILKCETMSIDTPYKFLFDYIHYYIFLWIFPYGYGVELQGITISPPDKLS